MGWRNDMCTCVRLCARKWNLWLLAKERKSELSAASETAPNCLEENVQQKMKLSYDHLIIYVYLIFNTRPTTNTNADENACVRARAQFWILFGRCDVYELFIIINCLIFFCARSFRVRKNNGRMNIEMSYLLCCRTQSRRIWSKPQSMPERPLKGVICKYICKFIYYTEQYIKTKPLSHTVSSPNDWHISHMEHTPDPLINTITVLQHCLCGRCQFKRVHEIKDARIRTISKTYYSANSLVKYIA